MSHVAAGPKAFGHAPVLSHVVSKEPDGCRAAGMQTGIRGVSQHLQAEGLATERSCCAWTEFLKTKILLTLIFIHSSIINSLIGEFNPFTLKIIASILFYQLNYFAFCFRICLVPLFCPCCLVVFWLVKFDSILCVFSGGAALWPWPWPAFHSRLLDRPQRPRKVGLVGVNSLGLLLLSLRSVSSSCVWVAWLGSVRLLSWRKLSTDH